MAVLKRAVPRTATKVEGKPSALALKPWVVDPLEVHMVSRHSIGFWANNPRKNDQAAKELAPILKKQGVRTPIVVWRKNMVVYKGNTTMKALDILHGGAEYKVPVVFHDWATEAEAIAYGIADNRAGENSEWDPDILGQLMAATEMKPLLEFTGFKEKELNALAWMPNMNKIDGIEENDEGMAGVIRIQCKAEDKASVLEILEAWAADCGYEGVKVK